MPLQNTSCATKTEYLAQGIQPTPGTQPQSVAGPGGEAAGFISSATSSTHSFETTKNKLRRMRRGVISAANIHQTEMQEARSRYRAVFLTLTYRDVDGWEPDHISDFCHHLRSWLARRSIDARYVWVLELQKRGAPHYHVLIFLPRGITLPKPDKQGWWRHGFSKIEWARRPVGYLAKYASKDASKGTLPKGARLWANAGLRGHGREVLRWWLAPAWLRSMASPGDVLRRQGEWWENRTLGIAYRSPWVLDNFDGGTANFVFLGWGEDDVRFLHAS